MNAKTSSHRDAAHRHATPRIATRRDATQRNGSSTILGDYFAVVGSTYTDEDAQVAGPELRRLYNNGLTDRDHIWRAAADPDSPLHGLACWDGWDERAAAEKHWRHTGAHLAASIEVEVTLPSGESLRTRAFQALPTIVVDDAEPNVRPLRTYTPIDVILASHDLRSQMLQDAMRDLRNFRSRYRTIEDMLGRVPLAIDETLAEHEDAA